MDPLRNPLNDLRPLWLIGPSGSGKSARAAECVRHYRGKVPICYLQLRDAANGNKKAASVEEMAQRVFKTVGYSASPSLVERLLDPDYETRRLNAALNDIFDVAAFLTRFRRSRFYPWAVPDEHKHSIIIADDFSDLRSTPLGFETFFLFLSMAVEHGTDDEQVWTVALVSEGQVASQVVSSQHVRIVLEDQPDPEVQDVRAALMAKGYTPDNIDKIIGICGPRLGLLAPLLRASPSKLQAQSAFVDATLEKHVADAGAAIEQAMRGTTQEEGRAAMAAAFDRLDAAAAKKGHPLDFSDLPEPYCCMESSPDAVLFYAPGGEVCFQSEAVREAWKRMKPAPAAESVRGLSSLALIMSRLQALSPMKLLPNGATGATNPKKTPMPAAG